MGLLAATSTVVDPPAIADMFARCRSWRDGIEVMGLLTADETHDAVAGMIERW